MQFSSLPKVSWIATDWSIVGTPAQRQPLPPPRCSKTRNNPKERHLVHVVKAESAAGDTCNPDVFSFPRCWPSPNQAATHWLRDVTSGLPSAPLGLDKTSGQWSKEDYDSQQIRVPTWAKLIHNSSGNNCYGTFIQTEVGYCISESVFVIRTFHFLTNEKMSHHISIKLICIFYTSFHFL